MYNIWEMGYTIKRDGKEITLTKEEVREINFLFNAANGYGSLEYFIDTCTWDGGMDNHKRIAEELIKDNERCSDIWNNYIENISYDTGDIEYQTVLEYVETYMENEPNN